MATDAEIDLVNAALDFVRAYRDAARKATAYFKVDAGGRFPALEQAARAVEVERKKPRLREEIQALRDKLAMAEAELAEAYRTGGE